MNTVKFKQHPAKSFNSLMDDFFIQFPSFYRDDYATIKQSIPANVKQTEGGYQLEIVAPGFSKEDIKVKVEKNLLTISAEVKAQENTAEKNIRREYQFQSFNRSFKLDEKIDTESIEGKYENGVLTLNLRLKAEVKAPVKEITIL